jgi:hypothetical protein
MLIRFYWGCNLGSGTIEAGTESERDPIADRRPSGRPGGTSTARAGNGDLHGEKKLSSNQDKKNKILFKF